MHHETLYLSTLCKNWAQSAWLTDRWILTDRVAFAKCVSMFECPSTTVLNVVFNTPLYCTIFPEAGAWQWMWYTYSMPHRPRYLRGCFGQESCCLIQFFLGAMSLQDFVFKAQDISGSGMGNVICFQPFNGCMQHCKHIVFIMASLKDCDVIHLPIFMFQPSYSIPKRLYTLCLLNCSVCFTQHHNRSRKKLKLFLFKLGKKTHTNKRRYDLSKIYTSAVCSMLVLHTAYYCLEDSFYFLNVFLCILIFPLCCIVWTQIIVMLTPLSYIL